MLFFSLLQKTQVLLGSGESIRLSLLCHLLFLCLKMGTKKIMGKETPGGDTCGHSDVGFHTGCSGTQCSEVAGEWPANQLV